MSKEKPILMCTDMVCATLEGRKLQTRRIATEWKLFGNKHTVHHEPGATIADWEMEHFLSSCPYGQVGDRLWVRETWRALDIWDQDKPSKIPEGALVRYEADGGSMERVEDGGTFRYGKTRVSIFMPRWASRILLEIVDIRVERVQAITEADCYAEGILLPCAPTGEILIDVSSKYAAVNYLPKLLKDAAPTDAELAIAYYAALWDSLNHDRGFGWAVDPFVWVITFKVAEVKS